MGNENIDSHEGINSGLIGRRKLVKSVGGLALASAGMFAAGPMGLQSVAKAQSDSSGNYTSIYNVRDYGATGNGSTDDRPAIQSAINAAISNDGGIVFLPAATYALGDTLQIRSSNIVLQGAGTGSVLKATFPDGNVIYAGQPTPSSPQTINVQFRNFAIVASVVKSSGAAIFCERAQRFIMEDVKASAQEAQNNLYDGFYFQLFDTCVISNCQIVHRHAGVTANGQPNQAFGAGLWIIGGSRIIANDTPGSIGVHLGGSTGGIAIEDTDIIVNETGVLLDDTLSGATNREVFLNQCFVDSSANYGVDVMPGGVAVLHFNNTWLASSGRPNTKGFPDGANIHVRKGGITNVPSVIVDGCRVFNAFGSGIEAYSGA